MTSVLRHLSKNFDMRTAAIGIPDTERDTILIFRFFDMRLEDKRFWTELIASIPQI
jgi:hypothetical protein